MPDPNENTAQLGEQLVSSMSTKDAESNAGVDSAESLSKRAVSLLERYMQHRKKEDIDQAIALQETLISTHYHDSGDADTRSSALYTLATAFLTRFRHFGSQDDLLRAIDTYREALEYYQSASFSDNQRNGRVQTLEGLAGAMRTRFNFTGDMKDINASVEYVRHAVDLAVGRQSWFRAAVLNSLGNSLLTRYWKTSNRQDLMDAIQCHRDTYSLYSSEDDDGTGSADDRRSRALNNLGTSLWNLYRHDRKLADLNEAIDIVRQALELRPPGHPERFSTLQNISSTLRERFDLLGDVDDITDSVIYSRECVSLYPPNHIGQPLGLINHGIALYARYQALYILADLDEAQQALMEAFPRAQSSDRPAAVLNLARVMYSHYSRNHESQQLDSTIYVLRGSLALSGISPSMEAPLAMMMLGGCLVTRFERSGTKSMTDLDEAVELLQKAIKQTADVGYTRGLCLENLSYAYNARFWSLHHTSDLQLAIDTCISSIDISPADDFHRAMRYARLADMYIEMKDYQKAYESWEKCVLHPAATILFRGNIAMKWAMIAHEQKDYVSMLKAFNLAVPMLNQGLLLYPSLVMRQWFLSAQENNQLHRTGPQACAGALSAGAVVNALELLEQGRAMLFGKMRGYRQAVDQLRDIDGKLADDFERISHEIEKISMTQVEDGENPRINIAAPAGSSSFATPNATAYDLRAKMNRQLSVELEVVLEKIRRIPQFKNFLRAIPFSELRKVASEGPIIIVNISSLRSDAIILMHTLKEPVVVPLSTDLDAVVHETTVKLYQAKTKREGLTKVVQAILRELWEYIVSPVVEVLQSHNIQPKSRIWWCPTGKLGTLPLHAAGPYAGGKRNLPDLFVSSYTPTLSALIAARERASIHRSVPKILAIGQPSTTQPLASVEKELQILSCLGRRGDEGLQVDVLKAEDADTTSVFSGLQTHSWVHFSCHGHVKQEPFESSFELLNNDQLTLLDLMQARLPNAELAFLSACHSAALHEGSVSLDETLHLSAALQFCGFRSVVGTLWTIADDDAPDVTRDFYDFMFRPGTGPSEDGHGGEANFRDAAYALSDAIKKMRLRRVSVDRWVPFVHVGA